MRHTPCRSNSPVPPSRALVKYKRQPSWDNQLGRLPTEVVSSTTGIGALNEARGDHDIELPYDLAGKVDRELVVGDHPGSSNLDSSVVEAELFDGPEGGVGAVAPRDTEQPDRLIGCGQALDRHEQRQPVRRRHRIGQRTGAVELERRLPGERRRHVLANGPRVHSLQPLPFGHTTLPTPAPIIGQESRLPADRAPTTGRAPSVIEL